MKKHLLLLTIFGCFYGTAQANSARTEDASIDAGSMQYEEQAAQDNEVAVGIGVEVGPGGAGIGVGVAPGGYVYGGRYYYDDRYCDAAGNCYYGYYDDGYYNDGIIWVGPGWYYGRWIGTEPAFWGWRRNYYWRDHGRLGYGRYRRGYGRRDRSWGRRGSRRSYSRHSGGRRSGGSRHHGGGGGGGRSRRR